MTSIVITAAKRSPIGAFQGSLSGMKSPEIAAHVMKNLYPKEHSLKADEVILGCVLSAGIGQAPARQATLLSGMDASTSSTTVNKVCGSGMKSLMIAADQLRLGHAKSIIAGGMESMTNAPYLLLRARSGLRMGHGDIIDHMMWDGLEDAMHSKNNTSQRKAMGCFADETASKYGFSRQDQENFAIKTFENYQKAHQKGCFKHEIVPFSFGETLFETDEPPSKVKIEKFGKLRPAFHPDGTVTAATSSSIADGAAITHLMTEAHAKDQGEKPLAFIKGYTSFSCAPEWFTTAPIGAIEKLLKQTGWSLKDVDLFEINEAFAVVPMAAMHDLKIDPSKVNIHGGACTLGHPIGASGARIVTTLVHALRTHGLKKGIAAACIGGGEATAMAIEIGA